MDDTLLKKCVCISFDRNRVLDTEQHFQIHNYLLLEGPLKVNKKKISWLDPTFSWRISNSEEFQRISKEKMNLLCGF